MSRVAVYIRVSTDEQAQSAETQERAAVAWCQRSGHTIIETYRDVGHSGAEWVQRPGILALEAAARRSPRPWDVVVVRDADRLGRDAFRLPRLVSVFRDRGIQVIEYSTGRTMELDGAGMIVVNVLAAVAQVEREAIAKRTRGAHAAMHAEGRVVGGKVYGYRNVRTPSGVRYEVDPTEGAVVRELYARHAAGESARSLACDLNRRGVPSPSAGSRGTGSWAPSTVHLILRNVRYKGILRWGDRGSAYREGTRVESHGHPTVDVAAPHLAIVSAEEWAGAQVRTRPARVAAGRARGRSAAPRYLLVGLARCEHCGGPVASTRTKRGHETVTAYTCAWRRERGPSICTAAWVRPTDVCDRVVLDWLAQDVLNPSHLRDAIARSRARLLSPEPVDEARRERLRAEERELSAAVAKLTLAAETADDVPELAARLRDRSGRLKAVRAELAALTAPAPVVPIGVDAMIDEAVAAIAATLVESTAAARRVLDAVLPERLRFSWKLIRDGVGRGRESEVWIEGSADLGAVLRAIAGSTMGVSMSPEGDEQTDRTTLAPKIPIDIVADVRTAA